MSTNICQRMVTRVCVLLKASARGSHEDPGIVVCGTRMDGIVRHQQISPRTITVKIPGMITVVCVLMFLLIFNLYKC